MPVVKATFDGRVCVPSSPLDIPEGTQVDIVVPPRKPTEEENRKWQEILAALDESPPPQPTLEDAMRAMRKYP